MLVACSIKENQVKEMVRPKVFTRRIGDDVALTDFLQKGDGKG